MSDRFRGWVFVAGQFLLLALLFFGAEPTPGLAGWVQVGLWLAIAAGAGLAVWSARGLGPALTATPVPKPGGQLVTTGRYRRVRHPVYSGLLLASLGWLCLHLSLPRAGLWLALLGLLWWKSGFEERLLAAKFPDYPAYAARTGRLLPRLRR